MDAQALWARIEDAALNASAPPQQFWLDGWLLRLSPEKARRARCIHALAPGGRVLDEQLAECAARFAAARLPLLFRITPFTQPAGLDAELAARGFTIEGDTWVMTRPHPHPQPEPGALPVVADARWTALPPTTFAQVVGTLRGSTPPEIEAHAQRLQGAPLPGQGVALQRPGDAQWLAAGQFIREGRLVGLYDVVTAPAARGQGLASLLCQRLLAQAASEGGDLPYLQVDADNAPARRVYHRMGFVVAYPYHYRRVSAA